MKRPNSLERFILASICSLVYYYRVRPEPIRAEHLSSFLLLGKLFPQILEKNMKVQTL